MPTVIPRRPSSYVVSTTFAKAYQAIKHRHSWQTHVGGLNASSHHQQSYGLIGDCFGINKVFELS
eukprot:scaffold80876_cov34-Prasinocladus_malaysianus.AAC.1